MKNILFVFACSLLTSLLNAQSTATQPTVPIIEYGEPISLESAERLMLAAKQEAITNGWTMAIAIVDTGGNLVLFEKMDNTQIGSVEIAMGKAKTANNFKRSTKMFEDAVANGGAALRLLAVQNILPIEGGEPILLKGKIIGAIGVSGMQSSQDGQVVKKALQVFNK